MTRRIKWSHKWNVRTELKRGGDGHTKAAFGVLAKRLTRSVSLGRVAKKSRGSPTTRKYDVMCIVLLLFSHVDIQTSIYLILCTVYSQVQVCQPVELQYGTVHLAQPFDITANYDDSADDAVNVAGGYFP